jgi:hypothetical protein
VEEAEPDTVLEMADPTATAARYLPMARQRARDLAMEAVSTATRAVLAAMGGAAPAEACWLGPVAARIAAAVKGEEVRRVRRHWGVLLPNSAGTADRARVTPLSS